MITVADLWNLLQTQHGIERTRLDRGEAGGLGGSVEVSYGSGTTRARVYRNRELVGLVDFRSDGYPERDVETLKELRQLLAEVGIGRVTT